MSDHTFCRQLKKSALAEAARFFTPEEIKKAWVYNTTLLWEFQGPGEFYTAFKACCAAEAHSKGWGQLVDIKRREGAQELLVPAVSKKVVPGVYEVTFPLTLHKDSEDIQTTATAEVSLRDEEYTWSYRLEADGHALSEHEDTYTSKKQILEFFNSPHSRHWQYLTEHGLNCWAVGGRNQ